MKNRFSVLLLLPFFCLAGCMKLTDKNAGDQPSDKARLGFDISVTRDGKPLTKGELVDATDLLATMDTRRPFSLVAIEESTGSLLLDNQPAYSDAKGDYSLYLDGSLLQIPTQVLFSAYYPYVKDITYEGGASAYAIPFQASETEAGPLVSKTVQRSIYQLNTLPLEFGHITNDIGFKVCDVTPTEALQGHIRLRSLTAHNVASAGVYVNDINVSRGNWNYQGYYRQVTVFEGDEKVGVGSSNEQAAGRRFYAIPDEIVMGKQYVEAVFDVEAFDYAGEHYGALSGISRKYLIYGLLPGNVMQPGKQYTFHIGLDLSSLYREISFNAGISDWETKIYEHNEDF